MSELALRVERLGKQYRIGNRRTFKHKVLRDTVSDALAAPVRALGARFAGHRLTGRRRPPSDGVIWALRNVSFETTRGTAVGIIGHNGAGKSTLLRILSRITEPTEGYAEIHGRVGSLLNVGTGFHHELTGRENIYLNGAILGMRKREIDRQLDEIIAFAQIDKFIDTPAKYYSSGMYMRLGFAVAAHLETEIILVDEVLAVGDAAFQKKCLGKMGDVARQGRTVFLVSHNMTAVQSLCRHAIWLQEGTIKAEGEPHEVVSRYLSSYSTTLTNRVWDDPSTAPGNDKVRLRRVSVQPAAPLPPLPRLPQLPPGVINTQTPLLLQIEYWNLVTGAQINVSLNLYNDQGILIFCTAPVREPVWHGRPFPVGLFRSVCRIPGDLLNDGTFRAELSVVENEGTIVYTLDDALIFDVYEGARSGAWYGKWPGAVRPNLEWSTELIDPGGVATLPTPQPPVRQERR